MNQVQERYPNIKPRAPSAAPLNSHGPSEPRAMEESIDFSKLLPDNDELSGPVIYGTVTADYAAKAPGELSVEETDMVKIYPEKSVSGYYFGSLNNNVGFFPQSVARIVTEDDVQGDTGSTSSSKTWYSKYFKSAESLSKESRSAKLKSTSISNISPTSSFTNDKQEKRSMITRSPGQRILWVDYIGGNDIVMKLNLTKQEIKRQEVIYEIITTEEDYVQDLEFLLEVL
jgi:hypothetical protein